MTSTSLQRLVDIGFARAGGWSLDEGTLGFDVSHYAQARNVLYAFVIDDELRYIGKTSRVLRSRMAGYRTPGATQSTNITNHQHILAALGRGQRVDIYVLPDNGLLHYGGFHINLAAGLEDSLIRELVPPWNGGKKETSAQTLAPLVPDASFDGDADGGGDASGEADPVVR